MPKTVEVTFGGDVYKVRRLNIGQLERITELLENETASNKRVFNLLAIVLERSDPKIENVSDLEPEDNEIHVALEKIMGASGMKPENPPKAPGAGAV